MRQRSVGTLVAFALAVTLAASPAAYGAPKVKGKVMIEGIVTAVNTFASTLTVQAQAKHNTVIETVLVQSATELRIKRGGKQGDQGEDEDEDEGGRFVHRAAVTDFRVGDRVKVEAFRLDDGRLLALRAQILNRAVAFQPQPQPVPQGLVAQGVVTGKSLNALTILDRGGVTRFVIVPATAVVTGQRTSFAAIVPNDVVRVEGVANSDNSITARQVEVVFAGAYQITGRITLKSPTPQFLIVNGSQSVNVASDTRIISGGQLRSFADLQVGQTVTVSGTPITIAGATIGVNAHVITF